jgi:tetratricopeptide (TPR) repeat protein
MNDQRALELPPSLQTELANQLSAKISRLLEKALSHHKDGRVDEAARLYSEILDVDPHQLDVLHLSGSIAYDEKRFDDAERYFIRALSVDSSFAVLHYSYGNVLAETGRFEQALARFDKAIALNKEYAEAFYNRGIVLARLQKVDEAIWSYDRAVTLKPDHFFAHANRSRLLEATGRYEEALVGCGKALGINPNSVGMHFNRAVMLQHLGRFDEALASYENAIDLDATYSQAQFNRAVLLGILKRFDEALMAINNFLEFNSEYADAYFNRGCIYKSQNRFEEAFKDFKKAISIEDSHFKSHYEVALIFDQLARSDEALASLEKAIHFRPDFAEAVYARGVVLKKLNKFEEALANYELAVKIKPSLASAYVNRAVILTEMNRVDEALASYDEALAINPDYAEVHNNQGVLLGNLYRYEDALACFDKAIIIKPDYAEAYGNRGNVLGHLLRIDDAIASYEKMGALLSGSAEADLDISHFLLLVGRFQQGLELYESRKKTKRAWGNRSFDKPLWLGKEDLREKTILVHDEQGLGDVIQFCRYLEKLTQVGAKVIFAVREPLIGLMQSLEYDITICSTENINSDFDFHCPLMSLPLAFNTDLLSIPSSERYLKAEEVRLKKWSKIIGKKGFRIGICWQGATEKLGAGRAFSITNFHHIAQLPGVRLISLHKGVGEAELQTLPKDMVVETLGSSFDSGPHAFLDTAAAMQCCDLVITCDTAVAHLAGALGVKTWVALKRLPNWRFFLDRNDSPWYPSMRLFRQRSHGDWVGVFEDMKHSILHELKLVDPALVAPLSFGTPEVQVSWGELIDKITILEIKSARIASQVALNNVRLELNLLNETAEKVLHSNTEVTRKKAELTVVNEALWEIEDKIREKEIASQFDDVFVELARSVYKTNDRRAAIKKEINVLLQSKLVEEKSYYA